MTQPREGRHSAALSHVAAAKIGGYLIFLPCADLLKAGIRLCLPTAKWLMVEYFFDVHGADTSPLNGTSWNHAGETELSPA